ncbi:hypothetical protein PR202_ga24673 [Eleusine coracana subsp. coracana]|uniref:Uncharacterized protein n=1 Tax=Eleusine coracana subsp. coracana TaxID=191504 RepID=A0AAV5D7E2_ELECO|nr:hypothetical protein PR202_ga24673 [Eleusine coracana subsp. coracana]
MGDPSRGSLDPGRPCGTMTRTETATAVEDSIGRASVAIAGTLNGSYARRGVVPCLPVRCLCKAPIMAGDICVGAQLPPLEPVIDRTLISNLSGLYDAIYPMTLAEEAKKKPVDNHGRTAPYGRVGQLPQLSTGRTLLLCCQPARGSSLPDAFFHGHSWLLQNTKEEEREKEKEGAKEFSNTNNFTIAIASRANLAAASAGGLLTVRTAAVEEPARGMFVMGVGNLWRRPG